MQNTAFYYRNRYIAGAKDVNQTITNHFEFQSELESGYFCSIYQFIISFGKQVPFFRIKFQ